MKRFQKGFTLIELLVVIAVIGVLAAIVLIAIDPIEQINRGNDAATKDKVSQIANAAAAAYTASGATGQQPVFPVDQVGLVASGDLKAQIAAPVNVGLLYLPSDSGTGTLDQMVVYGFMLSKQNISRASAGGPCTAPNRAYFTFTTSPGTAGKSGLLCKGSAPVPADSPF